MGSATAEPCYLYLSVWSGSCAVVSVRVLNIQDFADDRIQQSCVFLDNVIQKLTIFKNHELNLSKLTIDIVSYSLFDNLHGKETV